MKISEIVKVNINGTVPSIPTVTQMNNTGAIIFAHVIRSEDSGATMVNDFTWKTPSNMEAAYLGDTAVKRAVETYRINGGMELLIKRLYFPDTVTETDIANEIDKAVHGGSGILSTAHTALRDDVKNVQLIWHIDAGTTQPSFPLATIAKNLLVEGNPQESKILFVTSISAPTSLTTVPNIFYHYIGAVGNTNNYFESIAAMAYLSKINYETDEIKDYEYTVWGNGDSKVNLLNLSNTVRQDIEAGGKINFFSKTAGLNVLIGGVMTNGARLLSYYFGIILADRISTILTGLTLSKLKFRQSTYGYIYNTLTIELDKFANNGLLDTEFMASETSTVFRDEVRYTLVEAGQSLDYGYIVRTLPASQNDLFTREYTGVYVMYAIENQIRTMEIQGIVLGGV